MGASGKLVRRLIIQPSEQDWTLCRMNWDEMQAGIMCEGAEAGGRWLRPEEDGQPAKPFVMALGIEQRV